MKLPNKTQYPKELIIGDSEWKVKFCRVVDGNENLLGLCDPSVNTLSVKLKQDKMQTLLTFIHEVLHAMEAEYNFHLGEEKVLKLEKAIADFILVNSPIFERL